VEEWLPAHTGRLASRRFGPFMFKANSAMSALMLETPRTVLSISKTQSPGR